MPVSFFTLAPYLFWEGILEATSSDLSGLFLRILQQEPMDKLMIGRQRHFSKFYNVCLGLCLRHGHLE